MVKVGVLVGSLSRQAYSLRLAQYLATRLPEVEMLQLDYSELPFYNPDLERTEPLMEWTAFREAVRQVDGFLIVMPEYNLSIPAALKNALDVISVPAPALPVQGKPALAITDSSGSRGGMLANVHLHQVLQALGFAVLPAYVTIGKVSEVFMGDELTDEFEVRLLDEQLQKFKTALTQFTRSQAKQMAFQESFSLTKERLTLLEDRKPLGYADFRRTTGHLEINHVIVQPDQRGKGVARRIMVLLLAIAEETSLTVIPHCSYAQAFIDHHFEYQPLLAN